MDLTNEVEKIIGTSKGLTIEYKAVLPPSTNIAQSISAFANAEGGYIVLGIVEEPNGKLIINGLSDDFHANTIVHKALDLLLPQPIVEYQYVAYKSKKLYVIKVFKSEELIKIENKVYKREGPKIILQNPPKTHFKSNGYIKIREIYAQLEIFRNDSTIAKQKLLDHYRSILKMIDDLGNMLYPIDPNLPTINSEGKILNRILYSSFVDNFETYLSDLLYEIYLANPSTLKSKQQVTIEEVLNCTDLQEFVKYWAKQKIGKLQKGSVRGFVTDNKQISDLKIIDESTQTEIEKILQIRHLYSHRNGIVDEKFLQYFTGQFQMNAEHQIPINEICDKLFYLAGIVDKLDRAAMKLYGLS